MWSAFYFLVDYYFTFNYYFIFVSLTSRNIRCGPNCRCELWRNVIILITGISHLFENTINYNSTIKSSILLNNYPFLSPSHNKQLKWKICKAVVETTIMNECTFTFVSVIPVNKRRKKYHRGTVHPAPMKKKHKAEAWLCCTVGGTPEATEGCLGCEEASLPTYNTLKHQPSESIKPNVN